MVKVQDADVFEIELSGVVSAKDYEEVLIPAIEKKVASQEKLRVLYHVTPEFDSYEWGAMWDDAKAGIKFWSNWEKIAVVSDVEWIIKGVQMFAFAVPGSVKTFSNTQIDEAKEWLLS